MLGTFTPASTPTALSGSAAPEGWEDHWPLPPTEATPAQVYEWRLRHRATDAIDRQTAAMGAMLVEQGKLLAVQTEIRDELRATPPGLPISTQERLIFKTIDAVKGFVKTV